MSSDTKNEADEPLLCTLCVLTFKERSTLKRHLRLHEMVSDQLYDQVFKTAAMVPIHKNTMEDEIKGAFRKGDLVFAKVRGYPPWPGQVEGVVGERSNGVKYNILFFGSFERATCNESDVFHFEEHKEIYGKSRRRGFRESFQQIKEAAREHSLTSHSSYLGKPESKRKASRPSLHLVDHKISESRRKYTPKTHKKTKKGRKRFICKFCNKSFFCRSNLVQHIHVHTGERPFLCNLCGKKFARSWNLKIHQLIHSSEKPFQCRECGKRFVQHSSMKMHLKTHRDEMPYKCKVCGRSFKHPSNMKRHIFTHAKEKLFTCTVCQKRFFKKTALSKHLRVHVGKRPLKSKECGYVFSQKQSLNEHACSRGDGGSLVCPPLGKRNINMLIRFNSLERPFKCNVCGKEFFQMSTLHSHSTIHTGQWPYCCDICKTRFACQRLLAWHMKNHHV